MKPVRWSLCAAAILSAALSCHARAQAPVVAQLNAYLDRAHQDGLLNGNVLIADHGKVVLRRAIGTADGARTIPLTMGDRFDIGSITKEFDAVGIFILAQEGKLALTDPVSRFIPDLPPWSATLTIDHLLHYTSGLPDVDWDHVVTDADNMRSLRALKQLDFPAGTHYAYNNNNTFLRRQVIEKITGMSFADFLKTREFPKAGITDAVIDPTEATPNLAKGFDAKFKQDPVRVFLSGWTSLTADDLLHWSDCMTNFCLITPESTEKLVAPSNPKFQSGFGHGIVQDNRLLHHMHDGNDHNFEALLMADPPNGRTIILMTSQNREDVYAMADAIDSILDGKAYAPLTAAVK